MPPGTSGAPRVELGPGASRVVFSVAGAQVCEAAAGGLRAGALTLASAAFIGAAACNLVPYIEAAGAADVLPGAVAAGALAPGALGPEHFAPAPPLPATLGGTGIAAATAGAPLAGAGLGAAAVEPAAGAVWDAGARQLRLQGRALAVGPPPGVALALGDDFAGRRTLLVTSAGGGAADALLPGRAGPTCALSASPGAPASGAAHVQVTALGGFPVDAFVAWGAPPDLAGVNRASVVQPGRAGVLCSGRIPFRGAGAAFTITGLAPGAPVAVAAVMRDARGNVSPVALADLTAPP